MPTKKNRLMVNKKSKKNKKKSLIGKKKTKKNIKGGTAQIVMYKIYAKDDDTISNDNNKQRCMCVNYKDDGNNKFSVIHNEKLHRCDKPKAKNSNFCKDHQNCMGYVKQFLSGYEPNYDENELKR